MCVRDRSVLQTLPCRANENRQTDRSPSHSKANRGGAISIACPWRQTKEDAIKIFEGVEVVGSGSEVEIGQAQQVTMNFADSLPRLFRWQ